MTRLPDDPARARHARRRFLSLGGKSLAAGGLALSPLGQLLARAAGTPTVKGYGPLKAARDLATGLPLLMLPEGFSYRSFGWAGAPMADGNPTPNAHDGMGLVRVRGDVATLVRNQEVVSANGAFGPAASHYDPACGGGTVTMDFDLAKGEMLSIRPSLSGTLQNCAGGTTPWGSWLSCEEFVSPPGLQVGASDGMRTLERAHGFVFEVPAEGESSGEPLVGLGQFRHEAATVRPKDGIVYLTEDMEPEAGFYRFLPNRRGQLRRGGHLQMMKVIGRDDLRSGLAAGQRFKVEWVNIEHPEQGYDATAKDGRGVQRQGRAQGAARFTRLEGVIANDHEVFFTSTNGGDAACGQVFCFYPDEQELMLVYESPDPATLDYPDNVTLSPRGGLVLCQDSRGDVEHLYGLTRGGDLFAFARNNVHLDGYLGFSGDFRAAEWAGCCFSPDGHWLFANIYTPGFTVAITGPWRDGLI